MVRLGESKSEYMNLPHRGRSHIKVGITSRSVIWESATVTVFSTRPEDTRRTVVMPHRIWDAGTPVKGGREKRGLR